MSESESKNVTNGEVEKLDPSLDLAKKAAEEAQSETDVKAAKTKVIESLKQDFVELKALVESIKDQKTKEEAQKELDKIGDTDTFINQGLEGVDTAATGDKAPYAIDALQKKVEEMEHGDVTKRLIQLAKKSELAKTSAGNGIIDTARSAVKQLSEKLPFLGESAIAGFVLGIIEWIKEGKFLKSFFGNSLDEFHDEMWLQANKKDTIETINKTPGLRAVTTDWTDNEVLLLLREYDNSKEKSDGKDFNEFLQTRITTLKSKTNIDKAIKSCGSIYIKPKDLVSTYLDKLDIITFDSANQTTVRTSMDNGIEDTDKKTAAKNTEIKTALENQASVQALITLAKEASTAGKMNFTLATDKSITIEETERETLKTAITERIAKEIGAKSCSINAAENKITEIVGITSELKLPIENIEAQSDTKLITTFAFNEKDSKPIATEIKSIDELKKLITDTDNLMKNTNPYEIKNAYFKTDEIGKTLPGQIKNRGEFQRKVKEALAATNTEATARLSNMLALLPIYYPEAAAKVGAETVTQLQAITKEALDIPADSTIEIKIEKDKLVLKNLGTGETKFDVKIEAIQGNTNDVKITVANGSPTTVAITNVKTTINRIIQGAQNLDTTAKAIIAAVSHKKPTPDSATNK